MYALVYPEEGVRDPTLAIAIASLLCTGTHVGRIGIPDVWLEQLLVCPGLEPVDRLRPFDQDRGAVGFSQSGSGDARL